MGLVPVPADADADVIFGAKNLLDSCRGAAKCFDFPDNFCQPGRDRIGSLQLPQGVIVSEPERRYASLALKWAKLKGLEGQGLNPQNEFLLSSRRNEIGSVVQSFGLRGLVFKQS